MFTVMFLLQLGLLIVLCSIGSVISTTLQPAERNCLLIDQYLAVDEMLVSKDKNHYLRFQSDGNICMGSFANGVVSNKVMTSGWCTMVLNNNPGTLILQIDGNMVAYDTNGMWFWASNTRGNIEMVVQNDGNWGGGGWDCHSRGCPINPATGDDSCNAQSNNAVHIINTRQPSGQPTTRTSDDDAVILCDYYNTIPSVNQFAFANWCGEKNIGGTYMNGP